MKIYPFFLSHSGCPHCCSYCNQRSSAITPPPSPSAVTVWLQENLPDSGAGEVAFYGGTFTLLDSNLQQAYCDAVAPFLRAGRVGGVRISTRPDALTCKDAQRLRTAGVTTVELGCQSFDCDVLLRCGREYTADEIGSAVAVLRSAGLNVGLQLMPGLPGADYVEALDSLRQALQLTPNFLRIYPTVVLAGTQLADEYRRGEYVPWKLDRMVELCADMSLICQAKNIPVVRIGLQSVPELDSSDFLLAGPYHPAFGQLVRSRLWRRALSRLLDTGERLVGVHAADLSDALGHKKENFHFLSENYGEFKLVAESNVMRGHLVCNDDSHPLQELAA